MTLFRSEMEMTHSFTKLLMVLTCAMVIVAVPASANQLPQCSDGATLAFYIATYNGNGGCVIGDKIFNNFTYSNSAQGNANPVPAGGVTVDTLGPASTGASLLSLANPNDIGLRFTGSWIANGAGSATDSNIGFTVNVVNGGPLKIEDASLVQGSNFVDTGSASVAEQGCGPQPCTPVTWQVFTIDTSGNVKLGDHTFFAPTGSVQVVKDINASAGNATDGFAHLTYVEDAFSQTPEPRSMALLLSLGLFAGLAFKKLRTVRG